MITTIRAPREADAEAVTELLRACDVVIFGAPDTDIDDVRAEWTAPGFDLARDAWLVETKEGTLRAFAYVSARAEGRDYELDSLARPATLGVHRSANAREDQGRRRGSVFLHGGGRG